MPVPTTPAAPPKPTRGRAFRKAGPRSNLNLDVTWLYKKLEAKAASSGNKMSKKVAIFEKMVDLIKRNIKILAPRIEYFAGTLEKELAADYCDLEVEIADLLFELIRLAEVVRKQSTEEAPADNIPATMWTKQ